MHRFERFIAISAAMTFMGFAVAGYFESKQPSEMGPTAPSSVAILQR